MKKPEKIALIGLGAIGAAYAARIYDRDPHSIRIVADARRAGQIEKGITVNNKVYRFSCVSPQAESGPADLVLVAVKFHQLGQAIADIKKQVGPETVIASLMNGISSEEIIGRVYGMDKMLYAMCNGIDAVREADKVSYTSFGKVYFGEKSNTVLSERVRAVKELFERCGIPYVIPDNMPDTLWYKFMINVGINQCSAVLKAPYGVFLDVKEAGELMESAMLEVVTLAEKVGVRLEREQIAGFYPIIRTLSPQGKTSMLQDVEAKRKTEVEMLGGEVCELGKKYGVPTPVNETLFRQIRTIEQCY